ncbi:hypothetical protein EON65_14550 [archaeon]|nr:MAG: hypothetical protein EON65_14550 [archaeon]
MAILQLSAVVLTPPTYPGLVLDSTLLCDIRAFCHECGLPVIVGEAHGGHLKFMQRESVEDALM